MSDSKGEKKRPGSKHVDWEKFGLNADLNPASVPEPDTPGEEDQLFHGKASNENELFAEHQSSAAKPWWKVNFFVSEPILFGTWDGVFTSCMINIFGVIVFLRSGWMVAEAGILHSVLIIFTAVLVILASVFAGIGICERCPVDRGGVYFLLSHVLGGRIGGTVGILYCFGQAVGAAICSIGFGESIAKLIRVENIWIARGIAIGVLFILVVINIAGVIWVIKLQFILLIILLLAALDFSVGSFVRTSPDQGVDGYYSNNFWNNTAPAYSEGNNWFTVFGVFFPTMTGIFAGINMSGDLRNPSKDIPAGTLSAVGVCSCIYLGFILILGATCQRYYLLYDSLIAEKVSAVGVMFLAGLYISSVSACLATLYGTPRVLQSIALENIIPFLKFLGRGRGPNKVPVVGILVIATLTIIFILVGEINTLAPVATMPFMLTYASINYAYFALAMSYDSWKLKGRLESLGSPTFDSSASQKSGGEHRVSGYGTVREASDVDLLFPDRSKYKGKHHQFGSQSSSLISSPDEHSSVLSQSGESPESHQIVQGSNECLTDLAKLLPPGQSRKQQPHISAKSQSWYSHFCNRWISLLGVFANILIMFFVHWIYALCNIVVAVLIYTYIGKANPGIAPGVTEFRMVPWIKFSFMRLIGKGPVYDQMVVTPMHPGIEVMAAQLTEDNEDFAGRERYHQSSVVKTSKFDNLPSE